MPALMVQGCTSWAGKSWLATALCRWFARQGVRVAPFKAQNMANNARVLSGGGEIGTAQWLQARAAGVEPDPRMNPVLVKPEHHGSQVVRLGQVDHHLSRMAWSDRAPLLWPTARDALDDLLTEFELVLIEGAGSPAEINLADITNMRVAAHADSPVLLAVDIDRGGAFAHLYGTWMFVEDEHRDRIAGFVLNRFRGDPDLLAPAPARLEQLTGVPTIGVIPMVDHDLPDEDGAALRRTPQRGGLPRVVVVRYPTASNVDEYAALEQVADLVWATVPRHLDGADLVVLPGSKDVAADLGWMRDVALDRAVAEHARDGTPTLGVCGGLQMLGVAVGDPEGADGSADGLGILPVTTSLSRDKLTAPTVARFATELSGPWRALAGRRVEGYEIRHGATFTLDDTLVEALPDGLGWVQDNVLGVYLHGLFEDADLVEALVGGRPGRTIDATFERLADAVEAHLNTDLLRRLTRIQ